MATPTNHFKVGLFVIFAIGALVLTAIVLGAQRLHKDTLSYHTYFNESVQGLEVDSPVKFRGVTVGAVSAIAIAPDHRHVDVTAKISVESLEQLGFAKGGGRFEPSPDLRAQLSSAGITGGKIVAIDFFDPATTPAPPLPFAPAERYIPAAPSMLKSLEDSIAKATDKLPELVDTVLAVTTRADRMVAQLEKDNVTSEVASTLRHIDEVLTQLDVTIRRVNGENGLMASARRASDAVGNLGRGVGPTGRELEQTLREIREAAASVRVLADEIERNPDMLLKGRAKAKSEGDGK